MTVNSTLSPTVSVSDFVSSVISGGDITVNIAVLLISMPTWFLTRTLYAPKSRACRLARRRVLSVPPSTHLPSYIQKYSIGSEPSTTTVNVADSPTTANTSCGCVTILTGSGMLTVTTLDTASPALLLTVTV